jgi:TorA maturation chaperone TorD
VSPLALTEKGTRTDDPEALARTAVERSSLYRFLAAVFREELSPQLLEQVRSAPFREALAEAGVRLDERFLEGPEEALLEDLAVEYAYLFLGPGKHVSPHESVHAEGGSGVLWGRETVRVKRFIETTGLEYAPDYTGIPDHISVELEFVQKLALWEAAAWSKGGDTEGALYCLKVEKMFLDEHLSKWVPPFCDKVIAQAELPFYREMAGVTKDFLDFDRQRIDELMAPESRSRDA